MEEDECNFILIISAKQQQIIWNTALNLLLVLDVLVKVVVKVVTMMLLLRK